MTTMDPSSPEVSSAMKIGLIRISFESDIRGSVVIALKTKPRLETWGAWASATARTIATPMSRPKALARVSGETSLRATSASPSPRLEKPSMKLRNTCDIVIRP